MREQVFREVCKKAQEETGLDIRYTKSRKKDIVQTKSAIINVLHKFYGFNLPQIGELIGMHHTTVIHHLRDHPSRYRFEDEYCQLFDKLSRHAMSTSEHISVEKTLTLMRNALSI